MIRIVRCLLATILAGAGLVSVFADDSVAVRPRYDQGGRLLRPEGYREWVWLSSGLGMSYGPNGAQPGQDPPFDNVFVNPPAYRAFMQSGKWADGTMFVLEIRSSVSKGSINRGGHFQGALRAIEVEVKDGGKWSFYGFSESSPAGTRIPATASCYQCHATNGAVDNTFVQFYPTLIEVARAKGTYREPGTEASR